MKSFIYIMGVALLLVFCSCEKQGEQEQGTQRTEQGQGEKPEPESPEEPPFCLLYTSLLQSAPTERDCCGVLPVS